MQLYGDGHKIVTDADHISGRNYLLNTSQALSAKVVYGVGFTLGEYQFSSSLDFSKKYIFRAILYSDKDGGIFYCGSYPNWSVYQYQTIKKGANIISFSSQILQKSDGIKFSIDNCSAQVSLEEATLSEGTIIKEWQPAPEDYVMKSDQVLTTKNLIQALFSDELVNDVDDSFDMNNASPGIYRSWGKKPINAPDNAIAWAKYFVIPFIEGNSASMFQVAIDVNANIFTRAKGGDPATWIPWHRVNLV